MQMRWLVLQLPSWAKGVWKEAIYQGWPQTGHASLEGPHLGF